MTEDELRDALRDQCDRLATGIGRYVVLRALDAAATAIKEFALTPSAAPVTAPLPATSAPVLVDDGPVAMIVAPAVSRRGPKAKLIPPTKPAKPKGHSRAPHPKRPEGYRLFDQGKSVSDVARACGVSYGTACNWRDQRKAALMAGTSTVTTKPTRNGTATIARAPVTASTTKGTRVRWDTDDFKGSL